MRPETPDASEIAEEWKNGLEDFKLIQGLRCKGKGLDKGIFHAEDMGWAA